MNADVPWCLIFCNQKGSLAAAVPEFTSAEQDDPSPITELIVASTHKNSRAIGENMFEDRQKRLGIP